ncbi:DUF948 domain-containing protein [Bacillus sp. FJAT-44742]|uniref:DUF948 domain-containing protein n=1 Tax=Bacillus sp. FJAT-44742 TaxID=2014005 RepID=UPI000C242F5D|nr:DUF948 domain-containing protein [Bacillus sp. FJAT-44742]
MELVYISALIVALAFAALVVYVIKTLKAANSTIDRVANTLDNFEKQIKGITTETEHLMEKTNKIADDVQYKSDSLNSLFVSLKDVGDSLQTMNRSFKDVSTTVSQQSQQRSEEVAKVVQWGNAAIDLYAKWKDKKRQKDLEKQLKETKPRG